MGLRAKFNLLLLATFALRVGGAAVLDWQAAHQRAQQDVLAQARMMILLAGAVRHYTEGRVAPALAGARGGQFAPESSPFFAAKTVLADFSRGLPDYRFKEAALNPTNPADRAAPWQVQLIAGFAANRSLREQRIRRQTPAGPVLSVAQPVRVSARACLACHSTPEAAPPAMVRRYGATGGFGWTLGSVPAATIVSVPMRVALERANRLFVAALLRSVVMVGLTLLVLNLLLFHAIIRPVRQMAEIASEVSLGNAAAPEFAARGNDEIASLGRSFNRMRRSFMNAMKLLEG